MSGVLSLFEAVRGRYQTNPGFIWVFAGSGTKALGQLLFIWLLVRTEGPEGIGKYGVAVAWSVPVTVLACLDLMRVQATDYAEDYSFRQYFLLRCATSIAAFATITCLAWWFAKDAFTSVVGLGLMIAVAAVIEIYQTRMLQQADTVNYGKSMVAVNGTQWVIGSLSLLVTRSMALSFLVGSILSVVLLYLYLVPRLVELGYLPQSQVTSFTAEFHGLVSLLRYSFPLGLGLFIDSVTIQTPRLLMQHTQGIYGLGILMGFLAFLSAGSVAIEVVAQSITPLISRLWHARNEVKQLRFIYLVLVLGSGLSIIVVVLARLFGPKIASAVLGESFGGYPVAIAAVGGVFCLQLMQRIFSTAITASKVTRHLLNVYLVSLLVAITAGWVLIPRYGVEGAVFTMVMATGTKVAIMFTMLRHALTR